MPRYPLDPPIVAERPAAGNTYVDLMAAPLAKVYAPEAGEILYVGDGLDAPFTGYAPGLVIIGGTASKRKHVLGWLDRAYVDRLRAQGIWGWQGGQKPRPLAEFVYTLDDLFHDPARYPRPTVKEGDVVGAVSVSRGRLRWHVTTGEGGAENPLSWATKVGLPPPQLVPADPGPPVPVSPPVEAQGAGLNGLVMLGLAYLAWKELS